MKIVSYKKDTEWGGKETRYRIVDDNGKIVDDAQGYGYKTEKNASKVLWYRFKGGKQKIKEDKIKIHKNNKEVNFGKNEIEEIETDMFYELKSGDYDAKEFDRILKERGIEFKNGEWGVTDPHKYMLHKINGG